MRKLLVAFALSAGLLVSGLATETAEAGRGGGSGGRSSSSGSHGRSYSSGGSTSGRSYSGGRSPSGRSYSSGSSPGRPSATPGPSRSPPSTNPNRPPAGSGSSAHTKSYSSGSTPTNAPASANPDRPSTGNRPGASPKTYSAGSRTNPGQPPTGNGSLSGQRSASGDTSLSGKSYSSGSGSASAGTKPTGPSYDVAAGKRMQQEESRARYTKGQQPKPTYTDPRGNTRTIDPKDREIQDLRRELNHERWLSWEARQRQFYQPYSVAPHPVVVYHDPYSSFFWWWLLDRSLEERALWAYHHRSSMDEARYRELLAKDARLEARVRQLEGQGVPRDPSYHPPGIDPDLMYTKDYVDAAYNPQPAPPAVTAQVPSSASSQSRPPSGGSWRAMITVFIVLGVIVLVIWLVFYKRWGSSSCPDEQTAAAR